MKYGPPLLSFSGMMIKERHGLSSRRTSYKKGNIIYGTLFSLYTLTCKNVITVDAAVPTLQLQQKPSHCGEFLFGTSLHLGMLTAWSCLFTLNGTLRERDRGSGKMLPSSTQWLSTD
jgi:hypothetical protein